MNSFLIIEDPSAEPFPEEESIRAAEVKYAERVSFADLKGLEISKLWTLIIVNCRDFDEEKVNIILEFSERLKDSQFFVLAQSISNYAYSLMNRFSNIITLQKPCAPGLLSDLVKILCTEGISGLAKLPRFMSEVSVSVTVMGTGLLIYTRMKNITMTDAFLDYSGFSLKPGDLLKIHILRNKGKALTNANLKATRPEEKDMARSKDRNDDDQIKLSAQVIWVKTKKTSPNGQAGVGIKFIDFKNDVEKKGSTP